MKKVIFLMLLAILVIGGASAGWYYEEDIRDIFEDDEDSGTGNQAPVAAFSITPGTTVRVGEAVNFSASGSSDPDGDALTYEWDLGDGTTPSGETVSEHVYDAAGSYNVTLTVSDGQASDDETRQVVVKPPDYHDENSGNVAGTGDTDDIPFPVEEGAGEVRIQFTLTDTGTFGINPPASVTLRLTAANDTILREENDVDENGDDTWTFTGGEITSTGDYTFTIESENNGSMDYDYTIDVTY